jgi:hypothetical protein
MLCFLNLLGRPVCIICVWQPYLQNLECVDPFHVVPLNAVVLVHCSRSLVVVFLDGSLSLLVSVLSSDGTYTYFATATYTV